MQPRFFDMHHPVVAGVYFAAVLVMTMACLQPVLVCISLVVAVAYGCVLRGPRATVRSLAWQLPLLAIIALLNPVFVASGSTLVGELFGRPLYLEAFTYGACMGAMLVAVMQWASNAGQVMDSDKIMALTAKRFPTLSLMLTMVMRLIPQYVRRFREVDGTQRACFASEGQAALPRQARNMGVLMDWGMEDSLEAADAMRARAWGSSHVRSSYARHRFARGDAAALVGLVLLLAVDVVCAWQACAVSSFYPALACGAPAWAYAPHALFAFFPLAAEAAQSLSWRRS